MDHTSNKEGTLLSGLALSFGTTEPALRLLISILICYPFSLLHRHYMYGKSANLQNLYFVVVGVCIGIFNYGKDVYHNILCTVIQYMIFVVVGANKFSTVVSFIFQFGYLLIGYIYTESELYDIKWTMPHCVLTLRLIGLSFDFYDGSREPEKLSPQQKESALPSRPSVLTVAGHAFFPPTYLVGPLVSMQRYQTFISGAYLRQENEAVLKASESSSGKEFIISASHPRSLEAAFKRASLGIVYMLVYVVGSLFLNDNFILSEDFKTKSLIIKAILIGLWGKVCLSKYVSCWLLAEGACIMIGISYKGVFTPERPSSPPQPKYDVTSNVDLYIYETSTNLQDMIVCFNTNTNAWAAQYVFKRLKFMNNKQLSQGLTLLFLAVWHGLHSGYYASFAFEMLSVNTEREFLKLSSRYKWWTRLWSIHWIGPIKFVLLRLYSTCLLSYAITPFLLLTSAKYLSVCSSVYFYGHVLFITASLTMLASRYLARSRKPHSS